MPDLDPQLQQAITEAAQRFAQHWFSEACKIEEQVDEPERRWAILVAALRQLGWPKA